MKKFLSDQCVITKFSIYPILFLILSTISCERDTNSENIEIPKDSIYFSCKINNKSIELKTPNAIMNSEGKGLKRLHRLTNNAMDSAMIWYYYDCSDSNYIINFGVSGIFLVDTISSMGPEVKESLFKIGSYPLQFLNNSWSYKERSSNFYGFFMTIIDRKTNENYTSYIENSALNTTDEFIDNRANSSFQISYSNVANKEIKMLIKSTFKCKLYKYAQTDESILLTDGVLNFCL